MGATPSHEDDCEVAGSDDSDDDDILKMPHARHRVSSFRAFSHFVP